MSKLYTIGHSTRTLEEFIALLHEYKIRHLVDIRTIPRSRHVPWFNKEELDIALRNEDISYTHLLELGGLRPTHKDSINQGWHNLSFRGFADYMQTSEFYKALKKLNQFIKGAGNVILMCTEAVPWRCHRSLIADAEIVRHRNVFHIINKITLQAQLTPFAVVNRTKRPIKIYYPHD
ncbi:MAG: DNA repair protein [Candidatus Amoebophilus sp. 36-38]|nr:MAG: DNA repair protein [Candidatus Amoebophilus sp. 36-38]